MKNQDQKTDGERVQKAQEQLSHAWMVRTFVKHCEEVEDFPELMGVARAIFDLSRALEPRCGEPEEYLHMLKKKLPKFARAVEEFEHDAPLASTHMNFQQAVASVRAVLAELQALIVDR